MANSPNDASAYSFNWRVDNDIKSNNSWEISNSSVHEYDPSVVVDNAMRSSSSVVHDSPTHSDTSVIDNLLKSSTTPNSATHGVRSLTSLVKSLLRSTVTPNSAVISPTSVVDNLINTTTISHPSSKDNLLKSNTKPNSGKRVVRTLTSLMKSLLRRIVTPNSDVTSPTSVVDNLIKTTTISEDSSEYSEKGSQNFAYYSGVRVFSYAELEEAANHFDPSRELGEGGFGRVYFGILRDGRSIAVKKLHENNHRRVEQFMNEIEILARLVHPNLVSLYGCTSRHSRELLLVYEYIPNGTVADHLYGRRGKPKTLPWHIRMNIAVETATALKYLHVSEIIHRDVKTNNILLDNNFHVKVADVGLSRSFPNPLTHVSTAPQGTPGYLDPEYHQAYQLTSKSDVYSFGVVLIELISSLLAVDTRRDRPDINLANMAINKIQNQALHELVDPTLGFESDFKVGKMISAVAELAFQCLQSSRDMRPSMEEVLETLKDIKSDGKHKSQPKVTDMSSSADDILLIKDDPPPASL